MSTQIEMEYKNNKWYLTNVYRRRCKSPSQRYVSILTDDAKTAILNKYNNWE